MIKGKRDPIPYGRILFSLVIAGIIFSMIFATSYYVSYLNYRDISLNTELIRSYIIEMDGYLEDLSCDESILFEASRRLDIVGSRLSILEDRFGKDDERVLELKELYTDLELRHFSIIQDLNVKCEESFVTILYFYSNSKIDDKNEESSRMGFILSFFKSQNPEKVMVYSFDSNLESDAISSLIDKYNITEVPMTVVNEKDLVYVRNIKDLEIYL